MDKVLLYIFRILIWKRCSLFFKKFRIKWFDNFVCFITSNIGIMVIVWLGCCSIINEIFFFYGKYRKKKYNEEGKIWVDF